MSDTERKLAQLHCEAHFGEEPPPFARSWRPEIARSTSRGVTVGRARGRAGAPRWIWATAALFLATLSIAGGWRIRSAQRQRAMVQEVSLWAGRDPLGFLLDPPGNDVLQTVPTFDSKGEWQ